MMDIITLLLLLFSKCKRRKKKYINNESKRDTNFTKHTKKVVKIPKNQSKYNNTCSFCSYFESKKINTGKNKKITKTKRK